MTTSPLIVIIGPVDGALHQHWGANVREARLANGWSIKVLAAICGITPGALSNIEVGRRNARDEIKWKLAGALHRKPADLFPWPDVVPPFPARTKTT